MIFLPERYELVNTYTPNNTYFPNHIKDTHLTPPFKTIYLRTSERKTSKQTNVLDILTLLRQNMNNRMLKW